MVSAIATATAIPAARQTERPLRLILPKKGRLADDFAAVMEQAGLTFQKQGSRLDYGITADCEQRIAPTETLLQRAADALENLAGGLADMAIVGRDTYEEFTGANPESARNLRIARTFNDCSSCAMWIAAPENTPVEGPGDLAGMRIATSYPNALKRWLDDQGIGGVTIIARDGGIEDYVRLGMADAVCDVVDTGGTLAANRLGKRIKLFESSAVLVTGESAQNEQAQKLCERLGGEPGQAAPQPARRAPALAPRPAFA